MLFVSCLIRLLNPISFFRNCSRNYANRTSDDSLCSFSSFASPAGIYPAALTSLPSVVSVIDCLRFVDPRESVVDCLAMPVCGWESLLLAPEPASYGCDMACWPALVKLNLEPPSYACGYCDEEPLAEGLSGMKGMFVTTVDRRPLFLLLERLLFDRDMVVPGVELSPRSTVFTEISIWSYPSTNWKLPGSSFGSSITLSVYYLG